MKLRSFAGVSALSLALLAGSATQARANFLLSLNAPNSAVSPFTGPYGTVNFVRNSSTSYTVTLTALNNGGKFYLFGDGGTIGVNFNGAVSLFGSISHTNPLGGSSPALGGAGNISDFGNFSFSIDNGQGAANAVDTLTFTVTKDSGSWATDADLLVNNSDGFSVVGHVFVYDNASYNGGTATSTGFAGNGNTGPGPNVPAPPTAILAAAGGLSFGLSGLVGWKRRRQSAIA
jgi:hypothetical protein